MRLGHWVLVERRVSLGSKALYKELNIDHRMLVDGDNMGLRMCEVAIVPSQHFVGQCTVFPFLDRHTACRPDDSINSQPSLEISQSHR
jgi:hypothetical protein